VRGISELIALLIVIAVVIGTAVAVSMIVSSFMSKQTPSSADLSISISSAKLMGSNLYIQGIAVPVARDPIEVYTFEVYKGSTKISFSSYNLYVSNPMEPGDTYEFVLHLYSVSNVGVGDKIIVVFYWRTTTGTYSGASRATATVGS